MTRSTAILMIQGAIVLLVIIIIYPWSNMGDSLHSDGKNELVTGYVPCTCTAWRYFSIIVESVFTIEVLWFDSTLCSILKLNTDGKEN